MEHHLRHAGEAQTGFRKFRDRDGGESRTGNPAGSRTGADRSRLLKKCQPHGRPTGKQDSVPQPPCGLAGAIAPVLRFAYRRFAGSQRPRPSAVPEPAGQRGTVVRGRGNAVRFLFPPGEAKALSPLPWQGPSPLPQRRAAPCQPGAKAPGQRPTRPRRALLARRVGRWPSVVPGLADLRGTVARRRGKRDAFPDPAQSGTPCPRTGKIFPAGRQADCFFSTLSGTIFAADVRRCRCQNPSQIASQ